MSFGSMNVFIEILSTLVSTDSEGFSIGGDTVLANIRAYKEERHGNEKWSNRASFSNASALFRFRTIPGLTVTNKHIIVCNGERYNITSVEDVKGRGMYIEILGSLEEAGQNSKI
ncbi:MAG: head-tail adaptor protein [Eubacteriales bacterium]